MKRRASLALAILFLFSTLALFAAPVILPKGPGAVFLEGASLDFTLTDCPAGEKYTVSDWQGRIVAEGDFPAEGALVLPALTRGYYILTAGELRRDFCIVAPPEEHGAVDGKLPDRPNSVLAVDTAQSWCANPQALNCPWYEGDTYRLVSDLVYWAGIPCVRERLSWTEVWNDAVKPADYGKYMYNAELLAQHGVKISGMYHNAAKWAELGKDMAIPHDLKAAYDFAKTTSAAFGERMCDWEFWNEEDIGFAPDPVWDYAAAMKASALGFRAGCPGIKVANGAIALGVRGTPYPKVLFRNEIGKYIDILNYHTYDKIPSYAGIYDSLRDFEFETGLMGLPIWCTESGIRQDGEAKATSFWPGIQAHSPEQEMLQAEFYPKSQIGHWFNGCTRNFWFVFCPLNEGNGTKDWGLMRRDGSVKPIYAAMSTTMLYLAEAELLGRISAVPKGICAYLFQLPDGTQTLCYWSESPLDVNLHDTPVTFDGLHEQDFALTIADGTYATADMMGVKGVLAVQNGSAQLHATRYPAYITGLKGLTADVPPAPQGNAPAYTPAKDEDLSVIIRLDLNPEDFRVENVKTAAVMNKKTGRMTIEIWNLDNTPKTGQLLVEGAELEGLPEQIALPPMGKASIPVVMLPQYSNGVDITDLTLTGFFEGRYSTNTVIPYVCEAGTEWQVIPMDANRLETWGVNDSADWREFTWDEKEQAILFHVRWDDETKDRWFYPFYKLNLPRESLDGVAYLEFEVRIMQEKVENDVNCAFIMLQNKAEDSHLVSTNIAYPAPIGNWETRRIRLVQDGLDTASVTQFRLGCNPKGRDLKYWLRNMRLLKAK